MNPNDYQNFIESRLRIVDKESKEVPFVLNRIQAKFLLEDMSGRDIILKARQQGFSSLILGMFTADFLLKTNIRNVVIADNADNAKELLDRVKRYIRAYEDITGQKIPLKYNSKAELYNEATDSRYTIGTAENSNFGRSKTINNLHLSEIAFYEHIDEILSGALQAVVPTGRAILETTANGFNNFRRLWIDSVHGETTFKPLFYKASDFYNSEILGQKKLELKRQYRQEYPETPEEAFITSGDCFFDTDSLSEMLREADNYAQI